MMEIPVFVELLPNGKGFRARTGDPFAVSAESTDRATAIDEARKKLNILVANGQVVPVQIGQPNPAIALIGTLDMSDPRAQKWWEYVEEFRDYCDALVLPGESSGSAE